MTNLHDHIKQQQEENREKWDSLHKDRTVIPSRKETHELSDHITADTIEKTLEWVREVIEDLPCHKHGGVLPDGKVPAAILVGDLLEALTQLEDSKR